jgi:pyruvate-formate lyase-activating enzyme
VRIPCIPGLNDSQSDVQAIARHVASLGLCRIALLPYNAAAGAKYQWLGRPYPLAALVAQSEGHMASLESACRAEGLAAQIGG